MSELGNMFENVHVLLLHSLDVSPKMCSVFCCCSVTHSVVSNSLQPHRLQHTRLPLSFTISRSLLRLMSIESMMPSNYFMLRCLLHHPPSIFPSVRVFSNESALCIRWPKYWSFRFNINPSSEHPGLVSFTMDWLDLLAVQGNLKSILQHHCSKASILRRSDFFTSIHDHRKNHSLN